MIFIFGLLIATQQAANAASIQPTGEVKFNLNETLFDKNKIQEVFSGTKNKKLEIYFFDTANKAFQAKDTIQRLRVYQNESKLDITYKKRLVGQSINTGIQTLLNQGFDGSESNYKFEVDSKGTNNVLSVSRKETIKTTKKVTYGTVKLADALKLIKANVPKKMENWDTSSWYNTTLDQAIIYGPAQATSYKGQFEGKDIDIEVWTYNGKKMVELSVKTNSISESNQLKAAWQQKLAQLNYLSPDQRGKTNFVMD